MDSDIELEGIYRLMKQKWKYGHPDFYRLLLRMGEIHNIKNKGYGIGDPLGNFLECERFGIEAWKGCLVRMSDKYSRLCNLAAKIDSPEYQDAIKLENLEDTLIDLANYSLLCIILLRRRKQ